MDNTNGVNTKHLTSCCSTLRPKKNGPPRDAQKARAPKQGVKHQGEILEYLNFEPNLTRSSKKDLLRLENWVSIKIPNDYYDFLRETNGGESSLDLPEYYRLWSIEEIIENNESYEVGNNIHDHIGIGDAGGISMYLINMKTGEVFRYPYSLDQHFAEKVADSFTDFMQHIGQLGKKA